MFHQCVVPAHDAGSQPSIKFLLRLSYISHKEGFLWRITLERSKLSRCAEIFCLPPAPPKKCGLFHLCSMPITWTEMLVNYLIHFVGEDSPQENVWLINRRTEYMKLFTESGIWVLIQDGVAQKLLLYSRNRAMEYKNGNRVYSVCLLDQYMLLVSRILSSTDIFWAQENLTTEQLPFKDCICM